AHERVADHRHAERLREACGSDACLRLGLRHRAGTVPAAPDSAILRATSLPRTERIDPPVHAVHLCAAAVALALPLASQNQSAFFVSGSNSSIDVPYAPATVPTTGMTIEAWISYDETTLIGGAVYPTVARANPAPQVESWFLRVEAGSTAARILRFKVV